MSNRRKTICTFIIYVCYLLNTQLLNQLRRCCSSRQQQRRRRDLITAAAVRRAASIAAIDSFD